MTPELLKELVFVMVTLILSLAVHEFAHAAAARALGDDTALRQGRYTLDPRSHIDPLGTLVLPLFLVLSGSGFWFGWAKPVPFNPNKFTRKIRVKHSILITAAAGPLSNLALAVLCAGILHMVGDASGVVLELLSTMVILNVALFLFNLLPVPPLDGSKVAYGLLPDRYIARLKVLEHKPWIVPLAFVLIFVLAGHIIGPPLRALSSGLLGL